MKVFRVVTTLSLILILTLAAASVIGIAVTGFYPGIIVLLLLTLIPVGSKLYAKKITSEPNAFQKNYCAVLTAINILAMLVALWMTFVILTDRFFLVIL